MNNKLAFYMHAGSGNHGCEAIVDSLVRMLFGQTGTEGDPAESSVITLMTNSAQEDEQYLPQDVKNHLEIREEQHIEQHFADHVLYYVYRKITRDRESFLRYRLRPLCEKGSRPELAVSIGGDNYCYPSMVEDLMLANSMLKRQGTKTMLLGCSIEPDLLTKWDGRKKLIADMNRYDRIVARESITFQALLDAGIPEDKVILCPDPAFTLPVDESALPEGFKCGNTVGINLSPMIEDYAKDKSIALQSYETLIGHILATTDMDVVLIPHVVWDRNNDRIPLGKLYEKWQEEPRVRMLDDLPAEKIKGVIANCRFFIGARTHATIAAYSTLIPTLVIGYSVKARGIARDLFGTEENYVLPVQTLTDPQQLIRAWDWLLRHEDEMHYTLAGSVSKCRKLAMENGTEIRKMLS